ncbi:hypothetical protein NIVACYA_00190 [Planktothrix agardhii]|uniref:Uncharacterized protein n=1 Tax=Planktothrix agardhii TaxID=1160 RepID=A0AAD1PXL8_PLAAG|nr:hypothetical protein NIVACYA_00190 [Planktothrix agardhii]CAD5934787.1 hypothetical protein PCC7821_01519 [Planktothrix rubescens NIVA-CYA 18]CAH2572067.1 hypothetical protein PRNO82_01466 [Planktothrix rubescens]BBD53930.1 hypothetical protein NIES204_12140 [Planktothrix agardhii NIES-204]CAD5921313.1 hypothetical protein PANO66_00710 [Planktothrix agardhii]
MKQPEVLPQIPPPLAPRARGVWGSVPVFPFDQEF